MSYELDVKMEKVGALNQAIGRILSKPKRTVEEQLNLQDLAQQRKELMGTMPRLRLATKDGAICKPPLRLTHSPGPSSSSSSR